MGGFNGYRQLNEESVSAVTATPSVVPGEMRSEGGCDYLYVYNGSTNQTIDKGRGCKYASQSAGYTVDVAVAVVATLTADACVGVVKNATIPTGYYGWLCTRGYVDGLQCKNSAVVTGEAIFMTTSGVFQRYSATTIGESVERSYVGKCITGGVDTSATATFDARINCNANC